MYVSVTESNAIRVSQVIRTLGSNLNNPSHSPGGLFNIMA